MRLLLITNQCITDSTAGVTHSLRQILLWLTEAGHQVRCLCTTRFETKIPFDPDTHLRDWDPHARTRASSPCPLTFLTMRGVAVRLLHTRHHDETQPDAAEAEQFLAEFRRWIEQDRPDLLMALNGHRMIFEALALARHRRIPTAYAVRGYGYENPHYFKHVDHAFTCSPFLSEHYRRAIGLHSTPLEPPIDWSAVQPPPEVDPAERRFVTFINPMPTKGLTLFARLADMLGQKRADIPLLVIESGLSASHLHEIRGLNLKQYPQILVGPGTSDPWEIYALTKLLLVPSIWPEPFGRVAAEALINGIVPLVSERGALPWVIGGDAEAGGAGRVLPIPAWLSPHDPRLPSEEEVRPWFSAVCELWDDATRYQQLAARGRALAEERYSETISREKHLRYFESLTR